MEVVEVVEKNSSKFHNFHFHSFHIKLLKSLFFKGFIRIIIIYYNILYILRSFRP